VPATPRAAHSEASACSTVAHASSTRFHGAEVSNDSAAMPNWLKSHAGRRRTDGQLGRDPSGSDILTICKLLRSLLMMRHSTG
jgi:hypothetical protein